MTYSDHALDTDILDDDVIPHSTDLDLDLDLALDSAISSAEDIDEENLNEEALDAEGLNSVNKSQKKIKAHVVRRNVEDYLERKALERSLKEVFDDDFILD